MKVNISYSDYLDANGKEVIESATVYLDTNKLLQFTIVPPVLETDPKTCKIKMVDNTTVTEVEDVVNKQDFTELMALLRKISTQF